MMDKSKHRTLKVLIDKLLWEKWDPIGINDCDDAGDEYTAYAGAICGKLWDGQSKNDILAYMAWAECEHMGLTDDVYAVNRKNAQIVDEIFLLYESYR
jgi:endo-1,4-beta-D-glucanase Y